MISFSQYCESKAVFSNIDYYKRVIEVNKKAQASVDDYILKEGKKVNSGYHVRDLTVPYSILKSLKGEYSLEKYNKLISDGNINVSSTEITGLPKEIYIKDGNFYAGHCEKLKVLPESIIINTLYNKTAEVVLNYVPVTNVPKNIVTDSLFIYGTKITKLPRFVNDNIRVVQATYTNTLVEMEQGYTCETLIVDHTSLQRIPDDTNVKYMFARQSNVKEIGSNCKFGVLVLNRSSLKSIPKDIVVSLYCIIDNTPFRDNLLKQFNGDHSKMWDYLKNEYKNVRSWTANF